MEFGLIGRKLGHSFSPYIHNSLGGYDYDLFELEPSELDSFFKAREFRGINVTIPYKREVMKYLDFISDEAKAIGCVNTVVNKDGKLYGYNTDYLGLSASFDYFGVNLEGKKVAILGTGGTSSTAFYVAKNKGAALAVLVSRSKSKGDITYDELYSDYNDIDVIINTTPVGMYPKVDDLAVDLSRLNQVSAVCDVIYNPLKTSLVLEAEKRGITAFSGLYMLVSQAAFAAQKFVCKDFTLEIEEIYKRILSQKQNIVLIGMPSSGKSTIGKALSQKLNKEFVDTDEMIVNATGKEIADIFSEFGQEHFRQLEADEILNASLYSGCVIATGGGAILKEENINNLTRNGIIVFLDRPLAELVGTDSRPLAKTADMIKQRYNERIDIYRSVNDISVEIGSCVEENVDKIIDSIKNFR